jgi:hypothetical protein
MRSFYQDRLGTNIGKSLKKDDDFFSQVHAARSLRCFVRGRGAEQYYLAQHIHRHKVSQVTTRFLSFNQITTHNGRPISSIQPLYNRYEAVTQPLRLCASCCRSASAVSIGRTNTYNLTDRSLHDAVRKTDIF